MFSLSVCFVISSDNSQIVEREKTQQNEIFMDVRLNTSDPVALVAAIEKEPKFFDEFECRYNMNEAKSNQWIDFEKKVLCLIRKRKN